MKLVSIHGGHSGEFCTHAKDTLEEIVLAYIRQGFSWAGITEHIPPQSALQLYPDQKERGETPESLHALFAAYFKEARRLQQKYAERITLYVGMEGEVWRGYQEYIPQLIEEFQPDYLIGSVHHSTGRRTDTPFDFSPQHYKEAAERAGGMDALYQLYFDDQYRMLESLRPAVVGHFDLIRLFDGDYAARLKKPPIWRRIERNLERIAELGLILDYNQRALQKKAVEPYISEPILSLAAEMGIAIVPGDDSHCAADAGCSIKAACERLTALGLGGYAEVGKRLR